MDFMVVTAMRAEATRIIREQLTGVSLPIIKTLHDYCDYWIDSNTRGPELRPYFETALTALKNEFSGVRDAELLARFAMRAIKKCMVPN